MRNAWAHVEALQTSDLHALMQHIGQVLEFAVNEPEFIEDLSHGGNLNQSQEVLVFYYLSNLLRLLEQVHEDR